MIKFKLEFERKNPSEPYATGTKVEIMDIAPLPSVMVPANAQGNNQPGAAQNVNNSTQPGIVQPQQ
ncbi:MAG: hypothetical protein QM813_12150 [Verrucomicrobiota bacterium]